MAAKAKTQDEQTNDQTQTEDPKTALERARENAAAACEVIDEATASIMGLLVKLRDEKAALDLAIEASLEHNTVGAMKRWAKTVDGLPDPIAERIAKDLRKIVAVAVMPREMLRNVIATIEKHIAE
ncbi:MAG: hypothetical protein KDC95_09750 [Planctomycetes bacterium]|nr:hypothetical protein [Planctomycetota bacterium]